MSAAQWGHPLPTLSGTPGLPTWGQDVESHGQGRGQGLAWGAPSYCLQKLSPEAYMGIGHTHYWLSPPMFRWASMWDGSLQPPRAEGPVSTHRGSKWAQVPSHWALTAAVVSGGGGSYEVPPPSVLAHHSPSCAQAQRHRRQCPDTHCREVTAPLPIQWLIHCSSSAHLTPAATAEWRP